MDRRHVRGAGPGRLLRLRPGRGQRGRRLRHVDRQHHRLPGRHPDRRVRPGRLRRRRVRHGRRHILLALQHPVQWRLELRGDTLRQRRQSRHAADYLGHDLLPAGPPAADDPQGNRLTYTYNASNFEATLQLARESRMARLTHRISSSVNPGLGPELEAAAQRQLHDPRRIGPVRRPENVTTTEVPSANLNVAVAAGRWRFSRTARSAATAGRPAPR